MTIVNYDKIALFKEMTSQLQDKMSAVVFQYSPGVTLIFSSIVFR